MDRMCCRRPNRLTVIALAVVSLAWLVAPAPVSAADPAPAAKSAQKKSAPSAASSAESFFVAGLKPSRRPAGAPSIAKVSRDAAWMAAALRGVAQPVPPSLGFLASQGDWYTPFNRPGMTSPYDMRGWHG